MITSSLRQSPVWRGTAEQGCERGDTGVPGRRNLAAGPPYSPRPLPAPAPPGGTYLPQPGREHAGPGAAAGWRGHPTCLSLQPAPTPPTTARPRAPLPNRPARPKGRRSEGGRAPRPRRAESARVGAAHASPEPRRRLRSAPVPPGRARPSPRAPRPRLQPSIPPSLHPSSTRSPDAAAASPARPARPGAATRRAPSPGRPQPRAPRAAHPPPAPRPGALYLVRVRGQEDVELGFCRSIHLGPEGRGPRAASSPARL